MPFNLFIGPIDLLSFRFVLNFVFMPWTRSQNHINKSTFTKSNLLDGDICPTVINIIQCQDLGPRVCGSTLDYRTILDYFHVYDTTPISTCITFHNEVDLDSLTVG